MADKYSRVSPFRVMVDQVGYKPGARKVAVMPFACESFQVVNESGKICFEGKTKEFGLDASSGDTVVQADFSALQENGTYYVQAGSERSAVFCIGENVYDKVMRDMLRGFYFLRCGCGLDEQYAGVYKHGKCHDSIVKVWDNPEETFMATGGWHDAGDYGRYITAGSCAVAHLLFAWQMFPGVFEKLDMNIPESGNQVPDLLNECRYELEWFLKMQREDGGVYHKLTTQMHAPFVMPESDTAQLYALPVSSIATADFAAVCAQGAEVYADYDSAFSEALAKAAKKAYEWLRKNPAFLGFKNPDNCNTGEYGEGDDLSNRFWAASALYSLTGEKNYHDEMAEAYAKKFPRNAMGYAEVGGFGKLSYLLTKQQKDAALEAQMKDELMKEADFLVAMQNKCGYMVAMEDRDYCWGSNMNVMNRGIILAAADYFEGTDKRKDNVAAQLHYLLGVNAPSISYVTGNGDFCCNYPHLRPADQDGIEECIPGYVSGGPNGHPADERAIELIPVGTPPMKCYADHVDCYSLNEITIYWNSPAVFSVAYLMA